MSEKEAPKKPDFDHVLAELAEIVGELEQSDLPLEKSLEIFERGVGLSKQGQQMLDQAERRIEVLLDDGEKQPLLP